MFAHAPSLGRPHVGSGNTTLTYYPRQTFERGGNKKQVSLLSASNDFENRPLFIKVTGNWKGKELVVDKMDILHPVNYSQFDQQKYIRKKGQDYKSQSLGMYKLTIIFYIHLDLSFNLSIFLGGAQIVPSTKTLLLLYSVFFYP